MNTSVLTEKEFAEIIARNGGRVYRVGGSVRDSFMGLTPKDIDYSIVGMVKKNFKLLFPEAVECGKSFPVFHLEIDGVRREVAFARTERKVGSGYKGFKVSTKPKITIEEDLFRRDTTVNSMALDCLTGEVIDPFHGRRDIEGKVLRATSSHFSDDPIRALRLAGQSARFAFSIDRDTLSLAAAAQEELAHEPVGRVVAEMGKVLSEAKEPGQFFKVLAETNLLQVTFNEISDLSQEEFSRVFNKLNTVAGYTQNPKLRFAAFGLVMTKESLESWYRRMKFPSDWLEAAVTVGQTVELLKHPTPDRIVDSINKLRRGTLTVEEFDLIARAMKLPIPQLGLLKQAMTLSEGEVIPKGLKGKEIGEWFRKKHIEAVSKEASTEDL